jgi:hypothetical protein
MTHILTYWTLTKGDILDMLVARVGPTPMRRRETPTGCMWRNMRLAQVGSLLIALIR